MKKVLKLVLVLAMLAALTVTAFAASPTTIEVANNSGAAELIRVVATVEDGYTVEVVPPTGEAANRAAAESLANGNIEAFLGSFDIVVKDAAGNIVHSGVTVEITLDVSAFIGKSLVLLENTDGNITVAFSGVINSGTLTISLTQFSTFTPVIVGAPVSAGTSPQTSQSIVPVALICVAGMALIAVVIATKRKFN